MAKMVGYEKKYLTISTLFIALDAPSFHKGHANLLRIVRSMQDSFQNKSCAIVAEKMMLGPVILEVG